MFQETAIEVHIAHPKVYYTNGDIIRGKVILHNEKPRSIHGLKIKLKCDEVAAVVVSTGNGAYERVETKNYLHMVCVLFPTPELLDQQKKQSADYTLQAGVHEFSFKLQIPADSSIPQSYKVHQKSGIHWYLKAVLETPSLLINRKRRVVTVFEMRPNIPHLNYESNQKKVTEENATIYAFLPITHVPPSTALSKIKSLVPSADPKRHKSTVQLRVITPYEGLLQSDHTINVSLALSVDSSFSASLLAIKEFSCFLTQTFRVSVYRGVNSDRYRNHIELLKLKDVMWSLKEGQEKLRTALSETQIRTRIPPTKTYGSIQCQYVLEMELVLASMEEPRSSSTLKVHVPIEVLSFVAGEKTSSAKLPSIDTDVAPPQYCERFDPAASTFLADFDDHK